MHVRPHEPLLPRVRDRVAVPHEMHDPEIDGADRMQQKRVRGILGRIDDDARIGGFSHRSVDRDEGVGIQVEPRLEAASAQRAPDEARDVPESGERVS